MTDFKLLDWEGLCNLTTEELDKYVMDMQFLASVYKKILAGEPIETDEALEHVNHYLKAYIELNKFRNTIQKFTE